MSDLPEGGLALCLDPDLVEDEDLLLLVLPHLLLHQLAGLPLLHTSQHNTATMG